MYQWNNHPVYILQSLNKVYYILQFYKVSYSLSYILYILIYPTKSEKSAKNHRNRNYLNLPKPSYSLSIHSAKSEHRFEKLPKKLWPV